MGLRRQAPAPLPRGARQRAVSGGAEAPAELSVPRCCGCAWKDVGDAWLRWDRVLLAYRPDCAHGGQMGIAGDRAHLLKPSEMSARRGRPPEAVSERSGAA